MGGPEAAPGGVNGVSPEGPGVSFNGMPSLNELLHAASRTFAIGIDLLPHPLRGEVEVAYLLLRVSDYLEDEPSIEPGRKVLLLESWAEVLADRAPVDELEACILEESGEGPDALVARNVRQVLAAFRRYRPEARRIVRRHVRDSTLGMARWAARGPDMAEEADLDDYMHEVAGRVGWLLTELFALDVPAVARSREEMMALGREFGLALQTVNVIRGLPVDRERGWVFVPRSFAAESGSPWLTGEGGWERSAREAVLARLVRKADRHLAAARRYIAHLPRRHHGIRVFCLLPYLFAVRTLALSRGNPRVFREEVKISRTDVVRITRTARLLGWSDGWVRWYARRLGAAEGGTEPAPAWNGS